MTHDRINLGRRKQEGTPECQINLRNRKAATRSDSASTVGNIKLGSNSVDGSEDRNAAVNSANEPSGGADE